jgi:hypothetical protein
MTPRPADHKRTERRVVRWLSLWELPGTCALTTQVLTGCPVRSYVPAVTPPLKGWVRNGLWFALAFVAFSVVLALLDGAWLQALLIAFGDIPIAFTLWRDSRVKATAGPA